MGEGEGGEREKEDGKREKKEEDPERGGGKRVCYQDSPSTILWQVP